MADEWWRDYFSGLRLEVQQRLPSQERTEQEARFIQSSLDLTPGERVLDVPCGNGRHAIELATQGYEMTGVDITPALLDEAKHTAVDRGVAVRWEQLDMRNLPWEGDFDAAYCFGGSFGFFDDAGNFAFLDAVARALKPNGRFLLDTHVAESLFPNFQPRSWTQVDDILVLEKRDYDPAGSRVQTTWTLINERTGTIERKESAMRVYTFGGLYRLLGEKGFADCQGYGSLKGTPFELGSSRLYLLATKSP